MFTHHYNSIYEREKIEQKKTENDLVMKLLKKLKYIKHCNDVLLLLSNEMNCFFSQIHIHSLSLV